MEVKAKVLDVLRKPTTKKILLAVVGLLLLFFLAKYVIPVFLVLLSLIVAVIIGILRWKWLGLEFGTLTIVLLGMVFGPKVGGIVGFVLITLILIFGQTINTYAIWVIPGYTVLGIVSGIVGPESLVGFGITAVVVLHVFFTLCTFLFTPPSLVRYAPYAFSNVFVNIVLFRFLGEFLLKLMI